MTLHEVVTGGDADDHAAHLLALLSLEQMGPVRLRTILHRRTPAQAWAAVQEGRPAVPPPPDEHHIRISAGLLERWRRQTDDIDPGELLDHHRQGGRAFAVLRTPDYPTRLADDPEPPHLLVFAGDLGVADHSRSVAVVGTRGCSRAGFETAYALGRELASAGVAVVSGLASGIDAAAHRGALDAHATPPVAVVGTGLDVVYPRSNRQLWEEVARAGVVCSESPLGAQADRWRFPARNRIVAGLADLVVVVESRERGGSMHTVDEADRRGIEVMAVPGPVRAPASAGTNALLFEGRAPARGADDVLLALGLTSVADHRSTDPRPAPDPAGVMVLAAFEHQPATLDQLVLRTGLSLVEVCRAADWLVEHGWLERRGGWLAPVDESAAT